MTGLGSRRVVLPDDEQLLLTLHVRANFHSDSDWARQGGFDAYRTKWFSTRQPSEFLSDLEASLHDPTTLARVYLADADPAAFAWAIGYTIAGYDIRIAEIKEIAVFEHQEGKGYGSRIMSDIETWAKRWGADVLRSETGAANERSIRLHERAGLTVHRYAYEKLLRP